MVRVAILAAWASAASAAAQSGPELVTDRPDQTESALVVPVGTLQVEAGALWTRDQEGVERFEGFEAPGTLLRYGLFERLELRLAWAGRIDDELRGKHERFRFEGAADPELGVKLALAAEQGLRPELALLAHLSLPAGSDDVGSPRADLSIRLTAAHTLSDRVGLGWNAGYEAASFEDGRGEVHTLGRFVYTAALGFDLGERWGAFVELFGDLPASDPEPAAHSFDGGVTFLVRPRVQLDFSAGVGLNDAAPDRFFGFGLSFRLPR